MEKLVPVALGSGLSCREGRRSGTGGGISHAKDFFLSVLVVGERAEAILRVLPVGLSGPGNEGGLYRPILREQPGLAGLHRGPGAVQAVREEYTSRGEAPLGGTLSPLDTK